MPKKHRNSQKRIIFEDACYFVTFYPKHRFPYFKKSLFCNLFIENLRLCKQLKGFLLYGWVVIYEHIHLMLQPSNKFDISDVMFSIKKQFSHNVNKVMRYNKMICSSNNRAVSPSESDQTLGRFQREELTIEKRIHLLQTTHSFDLNVLRLKTRFSIKHLNRNSYPKSCLPTGRFKWQKSFIDHYIRNDWDFNDKMEYIAWNPDKHGLPSDWPYVYTNPKYENLCDES